MSRPANRPANPNRAAQTGLALLEVVIALSLGAALILSATVWPLLLRNTSQATRAATELVAGSVLAERTLRSAVHLAGYAGCLTDDRPTAMQPAIALYRKADRDSDLPAPAESALKKAVADTAVLFVQHAEPPGLKVALAEPAEPAGGQPAVRLELTGPTDGLKPEQDVWLTDCRRLVAGQLQGTAFGGKNLLVRLTGSPAEPEKPFLPRYLFVPVKKAFSLRNSGRKAEDGSVIVSLYVHEQKAKAPTARSPTNKSVATSEVAVGISRWQLSLDAHRLVAEIEVSSTGAVAGRLAGRMRKTMAIVIGRYNS